MLRENSRLIEQFTSLAAAAGPLDRLREKRWQVRPGRVDRAAHGGQVLAVCVARGPALSAPAQEFPRWDPTRAGGVIAVFKENEFDFGIDAEVVGFRGTRTLLMPHGDVEGIAPDRPARPPGPGRPCTCPCRPCRRW